MSFAICRSNIGEMSASGVKRHRRAAAIATAKLLMRTALPDFGESENRKYRNYLARFQYRNARQSGDDNRLRTYELGFKAELTAIQKHGDKLLQIFVQLVTRLSLAMPARKARHITDI